MQPSSLCYLNCYRNKCNHYIFSFFIFFSVQATELKSLETRQFATESKTGDLEKENAGISLIFWWLLCSVIHCHCINSRLADQTESSESELLISKSKIDQLERDNAGDDCKYSSTTHTHYL